MNLALWEQKNKKKKTRAESFAKFETRKKKTRKKKIEFTALRAKKLGKQMRSIFWKGNKLKNMHLALLELKNVKKKHALNHLQSEKRMKTWI